MSGEKTWAVVFPSALWFVDSRRCTTLIVLVVRVNMLSGPPPRSPTSVRFKRIFTWINKQPVSDRMYGGGDGETPVAVTALECQVGSNPGFCGVKPSHRRHEITRRCWADEGGRSQRRETATIVRSDQDSAPCGKVILAM